MPRAPRRNHGNTRTRYWCWTLNNYTQEECDHIRNLQHHDNVRYITYGIEVGEGGTPHLQGFIYLFRHQKFPYLKNLLGQRVHLEAMRGQPGEAISYCHKQGEYWEHGERPADQTPRTGFDSALAWLDRFIEENSRAPTPREVANGYPRAFTLYNNFMELARLRAPTPTLVPAGVELRSWQTQLLEEIREPCEDARGIKFFVDPVGGKGKTFFSQFMFSQFPERVQLMAPGKMIDMAYCVDESKDIYIFNISRRGVEHFQYRILEELKDRMVFSQKYTPVMKVLSKIPWVIVMMNEEPDMTALSEDRYEITYLE